MANPGDYGKLEQHNDGGDGHGGSETGNQKRQCVADAAERRHQSTYAAAKPRVAAAGEAAIVGERFGKTHADARAHGSSEADEKCVPTFVRCDGGGEQRCER